MSIPKLTTKFDFEITISDSGAHIKVVRLLDSAIKQFFIAGMTEGARPGLTGFMNSITDELADGYFPKPRKK